MIKKSKICKAASFKTLQNFKNDKKRTKICQKMKIIWQKMKKIDFSFIVAHFSPINEKLKKNEKREIYRLSATHKRYLSFHRYLCTNLFLIKGEAHQNYSIQCWTTISKSCFFLNSIKLKWILQVSNLCYWLLQQL